MPDAQIGPARLLLGDCIDRMSEVPDASVDMILTDLPYGTTYAKWDSVVKVDKLWTQYRRIIRGNGAIVLTSTQPFTSLLVTSALDLFRTEWIWDKVNAANFANANKQPLKQHETVLVFAKGQPPYYPIKVPGKPNHVQGSKAKACKRDTMLITERGSDDVSGMKFPKTILTIPKHSSQCKFHPTEKPVALCDYFIQTYSREGDTVLDSCMGSGSTGIAAVRSGRKFIGIELDQEYHGIAVNRIREATEVRDLFSPTIAA